MGVFSFSLQPVLNHRADIEEEKKTDYQQAMNLWQQQVEKVQQIQQKLVELNESFNTRGIVNVMELFQLTNYREQLRDELIKQEMLKEQSKKQVDVAQQNLLKAKLDVQVLEKLKEKNLQSHLQEERLEEMKQLDELACIKYARC